MLHPLARWAKLWSRWRRRASNPTEPPAFPAGAPEQLPDQLWRLRFLAGDRVREEHFFISFSAAVHWLAETEANAGPERPLTVWIGPAQRETTGLAKS